MSDVLQLSSGIELAAAAKNESLAQTFDKTFRERIEVIPEEAVKRG